MHSGDPAARKIAVSVPEIFNDISSDFRQIVWSEPILATVQLKSKFHIAEPAEAKLRQN